MPYVPSDEEHARLVAEMDTPRFRAQMAVLDAAREVDRNPTPTALDALRAAAAAAGIDVEEMETLARSDDVVPPDEFEADRQEIAAARRAARGVECCECGGTIQGGDRNVLREVSGWSALREQGGQNHVIGRRVTGRLMCGECAVRLRAGLAPTQETLPL